MKEINYQPSEEMLQELQKAAVNFYINYMQINNIQKSIYTSFGITIPGLQTVQKGIPSDLRKMGEPAPGKDVAILKIDKQNLPTVKLGDDSKLRAGDNVFVLGYPGAATWDPNLSEESYVESTLTSGLISARKTMIGGWDVFQMDAAISKGNSGGPVFNSQGEVIGISTFTSLDFQTGLQVQGMNFAIPVSIAMQFLKELNVVPEESRLTKLYKEGLDLAASGKYKKALEIFREINELNPGYPYVQEQISLARTAISDGKDKSGNYLIYVVIGLGAVIVIGGLIFLLSRFNFKVEVRGKNNAKAQAAAAQEQAAASQGEQQ